MYLVPNQIVVVFDHQYLLKESIDILCFLHGDNQQRKVASENSSTFWLGVASCGFRLIRLQGPLIINISGKNPGNLLDFLHEDHQVKVVSATTIFIWICPHVQLDCRIQ